MPSWILALFIFLIVVIRFLGLELSPPGFFLDEAAGASNILCLIQDGKDFHGQSWPLFSAAFEEAGFYTPVYLYGQYLWSHLVGNSIAGFRSFSAVINALTICLLFDLTRIKIGLKAGLWVALSAAIMPWSFQLSRIAWDPPLAAFFLVAFIWMVNISKVFWLSPLALSLALYSYSPTRIAAPLVLLFLPGISLQRKIALGSLTVMLCIPLAIYMRNPQFMERANTVAIWSSAFDNPYAHYSLIEFGQLFLNQYLEHFSFNFLFASGDINLRHSSHFSGMLSWYDALGILGALAIPLVSIAKLNNGNLTDSQKYLFKIALVGILAGMIPAALTRDGIPHALRSITAWPFFALLVGISINYWLNVFKSKKIEWAVFGTAAIFCLFYLIHYFEYYPKLAEKAFELQPRAEREPIADAYRRIENGSSCDDIRQEKNIRTFSPTVIGKSINFGLNGNGTAFLRDSWQMQEMWGLWSRGASSSIEVPLPVDVNAIHSFNIFIKPFISLRNPEQTIEVFVNQRLYTTLYLNKGQDYHLAIDLSDSDKQKKAIKVKFKYQNAVSPNKIDAQSNDARVIALGLISASFQ
ncbi:hypothetical protein ICN41_08905 [Polynucleobacter sp. 15G-AUS-farblos]|uniref:ArnT family glycosyltransferase n=1 Tax=Polynucleobacter sp. 15G-AUS-farblos TaxID=2689094 RepID=UPI001C0E2686|nr:hypothetical protein [Polynucleobacter sp. 15G-AUS-farblos]MBU3584102.1 hypothetical protein [Polynucleobacter sp. 15G-AUS-farblos]